MAAVAEKSSSIAPNNVCILSLQFLDNLAAVQNLLHQVQRRVVIVIRRFIRNQRSAAATVNCRSGQSRSRAAAMARMRSADSPGAGIIARSTVELHLVGRALEVVVAGFRDRQIRSAAAAVPAPCAQPRAARTSPSFQSDAIFANCLNNHLGRIAAAPSLQVVVREQDHVERVAGDPQPQRIGRTVLRGNPVYGNPIRKFHERLAESSPRGNHVRRRGLAVSLFRHAGEYLRVRRARLVVIRLRGREVRRRIAAAASTRA